MADIKSNKNMTKDETTSFIEGLLEKVKVMIGGSSLISISITAEPVKMLHCLMKMLEKTKFTKENAQVLGKAQLEILENFIAKEHLLSIDGGGADGASMRYVTEIYLAPCAVMTSLIALYQDKWDWKEKPHHFVPYLLSKFEGVYGSGNVSHILERINQREIIILSIKSMKKNGWQSGDWELPLTTFLH